MTKHFVCILIGFCAFNNILYQNTKSLCFQTLHGDYDSLTIYLLRVSYLCTLKDGVGECVRENYHVCTLYYILETVLRC